MSEGVWLQPAAPHLSVVHAMLSSHEASPQHAAQVLLSSQQGLPTGQSYLHTLCSQRPQPPCLQSAASRHSTGFRQPCSVLQISPGSHKPLLGLCPHVRRAPVQLSSVQSTSSLHSAAEQQLPQLALLPSGLGQHLSVLPHKGTVWHLPP